MELPKNYSFKDAEAKWQKAWEDLGVYRFDAKTKQPVYSCDTPPPTVSGKMHMGHAMAYSQADFIMRFHRMKGEHPFYPFGFDDNGLATERFVEKKCGVRGSRMPRPDFVKLCLRETVEAEKQLKRSWQGIGISCDWNLQYRTIDDWSMKTSQRSLLDLHKKGRLERKEAPLVICPQCQTVIAQVEMKDKELESFLNYIEVEAENGEKLQFATTRPEVLPACVGFSVNPEDQRYKHLIGKKVKIPLIDRWVPVKGDEETLPEYGTGAVYYCSYGGTDCIDWLTKHPDVKPVLVMDVSGRYNERAGKYKGMTSKEARQAVLEDLKAIGALKKQQPIKHAVNGHERGETEVEYVATKQWFIRYLDLKEKFLEAGAKLNWHPAHMKVRYDNWVKGLKWDWCVSRQRFFGVPFPIWYCAKCGEAVFADETELPVDPTASQPKAGQRCGKCRGTEFVGEKDVMDTWATSSLTPQIALKWREDEKFFGRMFPMSLRANGHDIITFWLFNTVVKSLLHEGKLPWKDVMINGYVTDPYGEKMSKSKGNVVEPNVVVERFGADALRYWAASCSLGEDLPYQEKDLVTGQKLVTKLWNAAKFCLTHLDKLEGGKPEKLAPLDAWLMGKLNQAVEAATRGFAAYEFHKPKMAADHFFWKEFCDNYLEMVKDRLYNAQAYPAEDVQSARWTLYTALLTILKLFAPLLPHVTEEIYSLYFAGKEKAESIHVSAWPEPFQEFADEKAVQAGDLAVLVVAAVRQFKSSKSLSLGAEVKRLSIDARERRLLEPLARDIQAAARAKELAFEKPAEPLQVADGLAIGVNV